MNELELLEYLKTKKQDFEKRIPLITNDKHYTSLLNALRFINKQIVLKSN